MAQRLATRDEICGPLGTPGGVAPALNAATDEQVQVWSDVAALTCAPRRFRTLASSAHALLTAHYLSTAPGLNLSPCGQDIAEEAGPLTAEADGPANRSFGSLASGEAMSGENALLATTSYGRAFLRIQTAVRGFGTVSVANGLNTITH